MKIRNLSTLLLGLVLMLLASVALATTVRTVQVVGEYQGVTYVLYGYDAASGCPYGRSFADSQGRSGCWAAVPTQKRFVLAQQRPVAAIRFLPYSATETCPPDTTSVTDCTNAE